MWNQDSGSLMSFASKEAFTFLLYFRIAAQNPKSFCTLMWNQDSGSLADRAVRRGSRSRCWHSFPSHQNMSESLTSMCRSCMEKENEKVWFTYSLLLLSNLHKEITHMIFESNIEQIIKSYQSCTLEIISNQCCHISW